MGTHDLSRVIASVTRSTALVVPGPIVTAPVYERAAFDPARLADVAAWAKVEVHRLQAQAIVAAGHSGLIVAGAASLISGVPVFAVRKNGEQSFSHSPAKVNAVAPRGAVERWVFLDDFVASGKTLRWAMQQVYHYRLVVSPIPTAILAYAGSNAPPIDAWWRESIAPEWDGWPAWFGKEIPVVEYERGMRW